MTERATPIIDDASDRVRAEVRVLWDRTGLLLAEAEQAMEPDMAYSVIMLRMTELMAGQIGRRRVRQLLLQMAATVMAETGPVVQQGEPV